MKYIPVNEMDYQIFHKLLNDYYREGEDADSPQEVIDGFIEHLFDLCKQGSISGCAAFEAGSVGFVLWNIDKPDSPFSNKPGFGTILEIGISEPYRQQGLGARLTAYAESQMAVSKYYVCAYGPAESFWSKCGYCFRGEFAENGLKIFEKCADELTVDTFC